MGSLKGAVSLIERKLKMIGDESDNDSKINRGSFVFFLKSSWKKIIAKKPNMKITRAQFRELTRDIAVEWRKLPRSSRDSYDALYENGFLIKNNLERQLNSNEINTYARGRRAHSSLSLSESLFNILELVAKDQLTNEKAIVVANKDRKKKRKQARRAVAPAFKNDHKVRPKVTSEFSSAMISGDAHIVKKKDDQSQATDSITGSAIRDIERSPYANVKPLTHSIQSTSSSRQTVKSQQSDISLKSHLSRQSEKLCQSEKSRQSGISLQFEKSRQSSISLQPEKSHQSDKLRQSENSRQSVMSLQSDEPLQLDMSRQSDTTRQSDKSPQTEKSRQSDNSLQSEKSLQTDMSLQSDISRQSDMSLDLNSHGSVAPEPMVEEVIVETLHMVPSMAKAVLQSESSTNADMDIENLEEEDMAIDEEETRVSSFADRPTVAVAAPVTQLVLADANKANKAMNEMDVSDELDQAKANSGESLNNILEVVAKEHITKKKSIVVANKVCKKKRKQTKTAAAKSSTLSIQSIKSTSSGQSDKHLSLHLNSHGSIASELMDEGPK